MKRNFLFTAATILMMGFTCASVKAQEPTDVQISFIYPIGSGGIQSVNHEYRNSINIIGGVNGGISNFEIGSVFNINKGNVNGLQLSGVINATTGESKGAILAGVANVNGGSTDGAMISGVVNATFGDASKAQISGCFNLAKNIDGGQISVINAAKNVTGGQIGVINAAKTVKGIQIGVINACDSISKGLPIGVISFVRNGYFAFEVGTSELLNGSISYKMGTEHFYNIFKVGMGAFDGKKNYVVGYGFGSLLNMKGPHQIAFELVGNNISHDGMWDEHINSISTFSARYKYNFNNHLSIVAGPTANVYITDQKINNVFGTVNVPYTLFQKVHNGKQISGWIGASAGIVLTL